jgi:hypothetical protein
MKKSKAAEFIDWLIVQNPNFPYKNEILIKSCLENLILNHYTPSQEGQSLLERIDPMSRQAAIHLELIQLEKQKENAQENLSFARRRLELIAQRVFDLEAEMEKTLKERTQPLDLRPDPEIT